MGLRYVLGCETNHGIVFVSYTWTIHSLLDVRVRFRVMVLGCVALDVWLCAVPLTTPGNSEAPISVSRGSQVHARAWSA